MFRGCMIFIVTNQAGIGRGYYSEQDFEVLTSWMTEQFMVQGIEISGVHFCPHHLEHVIAEYKIACNCRKPAPGMIQIAALEHDIDLSSSFLIGDKISDVDAGNAAGIKKSFLINGRYDSSELFDGKRYKNILDVVNYIENNLKGEGSGCNL